MKFGELLVKQGIVSEEALEQAIERQHAQGGLLGDNLLAIGAVTESELDKVFSAAPPAPTSIESTGLTEGFLIDLTLKIMEATRRQTITAMSDELKLSSAVVTQLLEELVNRRFVEMLSTGGEYSLDQRFGLTDRGKEMVVEAMERSQYVGPAPVPFETYCAKVEQQRIRHENITTEMIRECFSHLVVTDDMLRALGPGVNSGRAILMYGPPGNGKTSMAEALCETFGNTIFVPHCFEVDGQIIKVFDPVIHRPIENDKERKSSILLKETVREEKIDARWVLCRRPVLTTGGELTLEMLDLTFNPIARYYEAPLQLKATNGIFILDDFGRQKHRPKDILNRWIVPLEKQYDYLTLHTGKKFPVPFDELVIFSTNFPPKEMMDGAMLRRIPYKIEVGEPAREDFAAIFDTACARYDLKTPEGLVDYLFREFYDKKGVHMACYHPIFLVEQSLALCKFTNQPPHIDRELIDISLKNLETSY
jgi:predicted ATPase with chaperone activity